MLAFKVAEAEFPTRFGEFRIFGFESENKSEHAIALLMGDPAGMATPLVRIHSQCLTGDVFGSSRCDCGEQLDLALRKISAESCGILIYQLQEGRGIGLMNKLLAYSLQDHGHDTVEANEHLGFEPDERDYSLSAAILRHFAIRGARLMSNNPKKLAALEDEGFAPIERIAHEISPHEKTADYLRTKKTKLGHLLSKV